jgi:hypothetical protein
MFADTKSMIDIPSHWIKGQLLDLKKYTNGTARAYLLGEADTDPPGASISFDSLHDAQQFVSTWYSRESVGGIHG